MKRVLVIGSGYAGLSAATGLAQNGYRVTVLEKSKNIGGRTSSTQDAQSQEELDNGQHMFLGCYKQTRAFLSRIGADHHLHFRDCFETKMLGADGAKAFLRTFALPAPLNLLWGYLQYQAFGIRDRMSLIHVVRGFRKESEDALASMSCRDFLHRYHQSQRTQKRFWDLLILATLNISPERAPANLLRVVMEQGFMSSRKDSASGLADVGLTTMLAEPAAQFLEKHSGSLITKANVIKINTDQQKVTGVTLLDGSKLEADIVISAVAPDAYQKITQDVPELNKDHAHIQTLEPSPIVSLHVWLDQDIFEDPYVGFWDTPFHWVFRKSVFTKDPSVKHYTLVASSARSMVTMSVKELVELAQDTLGPLSSKVRIVRAKKSVVHNATWVPPLGNTSGRIPITTKLRNFYVAGDWVDTGLPCTIESASVSGHMVVDHLAGRKNRL